MIQADHVLRALENACSRIGRTLTAHATPRRLGAALRARPRGRARRDHPELTGRHRQALPGRAAPPVPAVRSPNGSTPPACATPTWRYGGPCRLARRPAPGAGRPWPAAGAARQAFGELQNLIWQARRSASTWPSWRSASTAPCTRRRCAELRARAARSRADRTRSSPRSGSWAGCRTGSARTPAAATWSASPARPTTSPPCTSWPSTRPRRPAAGARRRAAVRDRRGPAERSPAVLDGHARSSSRTPAAAADRAAGGWRSCSATPTRPSSSGPVDRDARSCTTRRPRWRPGRRGATSRLTLFHGRGGALGRGGGPAERRGAGAGTGLGRGRFKVTEQGEVIFARYGHPDIAQRHLEQVTTAVLLASTPAVEERARAAAASGSARWPTRSARGRAARVPLAGRDRRASPSGSRASAR